MVGDVVVMMDMAGGQGDGCGGTTQATKVKAKMASECKNFGG
jgi:hypothetical protein